MRLSLAPPRRAVPAGLCRLTHRQTDAIDPNRTLRASNLPVMQSTKLQLIVNLRTANPIGVTPPPSPLARADEVIE
jgi:hypothetical protein